MRREQDRSHRLPFGLLGRHRDGRSATRAPRQCRLPGQRLPGRGHHVDHGGAEAPESAGGLRDGFRDGGHGAARPRDRREEDQGRDQCRRRQSAGLPRRRAEGLRGSRREAQGRGGAGRRSAAAHRRAAQARHQGDGYRRGAAGPGCLDERLSRRLPDRPRPERGRRRGDHRPLRRLRGHAGLPDPCLRLEHGRSRPAGGRHALRPHHRVRRAVQRRQLHRLAPGAGLRQHGLPGRRGFGRRQLRARQARQHRRPDHDRDGRRADALRDRRSAGLHRARRGLRLHAGEVRTGRQGPGEGVGRQGAARNRHLQGLDDLPRRLQVQLDLHAGRPRGGGQGPPQRRDDRQEDAADAG